MVSHTKKYMDHYRHHGATGGIVQSMRRMSWKLEGSSVLLEIPLLSREFTFVWVFGCSHLVDVYGL